MAISVISLELLELNCPKCHYFVSLLVGTQYPDQTFSDLNEDFAYYRIFLCPVDKSFLSINIHDREFDGNCPDHKVKLQMLRDLPKECPRCGGPLEITEKEILKPEKENQ